MQNNAQQISETISTSASILEALSVDKRFGSLQALKDVTLRLRAGTIHSLLGENGAGKSTLVKCIMGYYQPDAGQITVAGHETEINRPQQAALAGICMVYQHFTVIDNMTVLENIMLARPNIPNTINWQSTAKAVEEKLIDLPFKFNLLQKVSSLSAGEKQKLEITKQLLLAPKILILDEPTSVLTPNEADEVLGQLKTLAHEKNLTVLMITHKFREVMAYSDDVTVLRKGQWVGSCKVSDTNPTLLSEMMMGQASQAKAIERKPFEPTSHKQFTLHQLSVLNEQGLTAVDGLNLEIQAGEIVGIAGISGNGQTELVAAISGQRAIKQGHVSVAGKRFTPTRENLQNQRFCVLPESPLHNACVGQMSVAQNMALRNYDLNLKGERVSFINFKKIKQQAIKLIEQFNVKTPSPDEPISNLSGGNVQRAVLARELSNKVKVLIVANPCFGLDFHSADFIRQQIMQARNEGAAVMLVSEDLDEIMQLSDRFFVMSNGALVLQGTPETADLVSIGHAMAGHNEEPSYEHAS